MKKNVIIWILTGLVIILFHLWQATDMRLKLCQQKIAVMTAERSQAITRQMKIGKENFEWQEFVRKAGVEKLLAEDFKATSGPKKEDIRTEINKRLLGYPREINVAESRRELIQKLLQAPFGKLYLASFMAEARETIRIYEEERKR